MMHVIKKLSFFFFLSATTSVLATPHLIQSASKNSGDPCAAGRSIYDPNGLCLQWIGDASGSIKYGTPAILYTTNKYSSGETVNGKADLGKNDPSWSTDGGAMYFGWISNYPGTPPYSSAGYYFSTYFNVGQSKNLCSFQISGQDLYNAEKNNRTIHFIISKNGDTYSCHQE